MIESKQLNNPTQTLTPEQIQVDRILAQHDIPTLIKKVQDAGIVGAGGAGFPTYVKLQAQAEIFLVNAAECEPLLKVDQQLIPKDPDKLIRGLLYGMKITGATEGIIALKEKYQPAIKALTPLLPSNIRIHILPDVYPAGDEVITIWMATGRQVAAAQLPISIGVLVNNIQTLIQLTDALELSQPVTEKTISINGAVHTPLTVKVPVGITLRELLSLTGGPTIENPAYIVGGPMMGKLIENLDELVTKTTGGLLVLPDDHIIIKRRKQTLASVLTMAKNVCEQCSMCTELCPRHLIGHELSPSEIIKSICYESVNQPSTILSALTCSECGICEAYACPVGISPIRVNQLLKQQLRAKGEVYNGELRPVDPMAQYRLIPTQRLVERLDLVRLNHKAPLKALDWKPKYVRIPLQQHIGKPSLSIVAVGQAVIKGECIAKAAENALGVDIHSSINGHIHLISDTDITISNGE